MDSMADQSQELWDVIVQHTPGHIEKQSVKIPSELTLHPISLERDLGDNPMSCHPNQNGCLLNSISKQFSSDPHIFQPLFGNSTVYPLLELQYFNDQFQSDGSFQKHVEMLIQQNYSFIYNTKNNRIIYLNPITFSHSFGETEQNITLEQFIEKGGTGFVFKVGALDRKHYALKIFDDPSVYFREIGFYEEFKDSGVVVALYESDHTRRSCLTPWLTTADKLIQKNQDKYTSKRTSAEIMYDLITIQLAFLEKGYIDTDFNLLNLAFDPDSDVQDRSKGRIKSLDRNLVKYTEVGRILVKEAFVPSAYFTNDSSVRENYVQMQPIRFFAGLLERSLLQLFTQDQKKWFDEFQTLVIQQDYDTLKQCMADYNHFIFDSGLENKLLEHIDDPHYDLNKKTLVEIITKLHQFTYVPSEYSEETNTQKNLRIEKQAHEYKTLLKEYLTTLAPFVSYAVASKPAIQPSLQSATEPFKTCSSLSPSLQLPLNSPFVTSAGPESKHTVAPAASKPSDSVTQLKRPSGPAYVMQSQQKSNACSQKIHTPKNITCSIFSSLSTYVGSMVHYVSKLFKSQPRTISNTWVLHDVSDRLVSCYLEKFDSYAVKPDAQRLVWYLSDGIKDLTQKIASLDPSRSALLKRQCYPRTLSSLIKQYEDLKDQYTLNQLKTTSVKLLQQKDMALHRIQLTLSRQGYLNTSSSNYRTQQQLLRYVGKHCPSLRIKNHNYSDHEASCNLLQRQVAELNSYSVSLVMRKTA